MGTRLIHILLAICFPAMATAQGSYATLKLQEIGNLLQQKGNAIGKCGIIPLKENHTFKSYEVRTDTSGTVIHIGAPLFARTATASAPSPIYDFVERYMLHMSLLSTHERNRYMADDKVEADLTAVAKIDSMCPFQIWNDEKGIHLTWSRKGENICRIDMPKEIQLIYGKNKIEIEEDFIKQLITTQEKDTSVTKISYPSLEHVTATEDSAYYVYKGGSYVIKEMHSDTYFVKNSEQRLIPLQDAKYPSETVSNLFHSLLDGEFILNVTQHLYGNRKISYRVAQNKLHTFCTEQGCKPYIGIESIEKESIKAVVVYENSEFGYNHMLYTEISPTVINNKQGEIKSHIYCYIPTHNLKSLFQEKTKKKQ